MSKTVKSKIVSFLDSFGKNTQLCYNANCSRISAMIKCDINKAIVENSMVGSSRYK